MKLFYLIVLLLCFSCGKSSDQQNIGTSKQGGHSSRSLLNLNDSCILAANYGFKKTIYQILLKDLRMSKRKSLKLTIR